MNEKHIQGSLQTMAMDTASFASVREFAEAYFQTQQPVDLLFLNAGTGDMAAPGDSLKCAKKTERDGIDYLFQVNYLSHHLLYRLLEPLLTENAKIIQTSSSSSFATFSYRVATDLQTLHGCSENLYNDPFFVENKSYGQSKLAQIVWVKALTRKLGPLSNQSANAFHPGMVNTKIFENVMEKAQVDDAKRRFMDGLLKYVWQSPDGALTGLYLAVTHGIKGRYFHPQAQEVVNPMSLDEQLQDDLWAFSDKLVENYLAPIEPPKHVHVQRESLPPDDEKETETEEKAGAATMAVDGAATKDDIAEEGSSKSASKDHADAILEETVPDEL
jgi:NAD(P)-dependent dehydrogenase (short-subunit alcohol dehydrogenase family)